MSNKKCYMCDRDATGKEHVPPKCFFPDNYKPNLITVPSCDEHNQKYSQDDEYVRGLIISSPQFEKFNEKYLSLHGDLFEKTIKSVKRRKASLGRRLLKDSEYILTDKPGITKKLKIERERFDRVMRKIACGLHFYKSGLYINTILTVYTRHIRHSDLSEDIAPIFLTFLEKSIKLKIPCEGNSPEIFHYSIGKFETIDGNIDVIKLVFYENFVVWVTPYDAVTEDMIKRVKKKDNKIQIVKSTNFIEPMRWVVPVVRVDPKIWVPSSHKK